MTRLLWLIPLVLCSCRSDPTTEPTSRPAPSAVPVPVASASAATEAGPDQTYAKHTAPAFVAECIERTWFGYLCNNAYAAVPQRFPAEAATIQALMRLGARVGAGKPLGGEGEVVSGCQVEKGQGDAYSCLYLAEGNTTDRGKAAHVLACKGAPPEGQVPVAGGTAACEGDKPILLHALPAAEGELVKRCFACGNSKETSQRDLSKLASAKACKTVMKHVPEKEAKFIERSIQPLCPKGS
jgi:hypothetical protein